MFEALRWRKTQFDTEAAMRNVADSLAHAGKAPLMLGSLAAVALLGLFTRMGLGRNWGGRSRATVIPARVRTAVENAMPAARNGRRRKKRKMKAAAHQ